ncbi:MAG: hypothetical protein ABJF01_24735 [bacterium]
MQQNPIEIPTSVALADLLARCKEIGRFTTEIAMAEVMRISALASALVVMRQVLGLEPIPAEKLPLRQRRIAHWGLTDPPHLGDALTPAIMAVRGSIALDEHEQVKILSDRTWRGAWGTVTLWRDGVHGISSATMMDYLARLVALAQERAPDVARSLLTRGEAVEAAGTLLPAGPRSRSD